MENFLQLRQGASLKLISATLLLIVVFLPQFSASGQTVTPSDHLKTPVELRKSPELNFKEITRFNNWGKRVSRLQERNLQFFPDTILVYSASENPRKYNYLFSNTGELLTCLVRIKQGAQWVNESIENRTYDAASNMTLQQWQAWNGTAWVNTTRNLFTYDNNRNLLTHTEQVWNPGTGGWTNFRRTTNTWSASGLHLTMLQEFFSGNSWVNQAYEFYVWQNNLLVQAERQIWLNGNWSSEYQYFYTYDAQNNLSSFTMKQWSGTQWADFYNEVYSYNSSNQLISYISQIFTNTWQNSEQYFYTYDVLGFLESAQRQVWEGGIWQNSLRRTFTNNNFGSIQLAIYEIWEQNSWINQNLFTKAFDESGNTTVSNVYFWSGGWQQNQDNQIEIDYNYGLKTLRFQGYKAEAGFTSMLVPNREPNETKHLTVYPNPTDGSLFIFNELLTTEFIYLHIFASDGKLVFSRKYQPGSPISLDLRSKGLTAGVYVLKLISSEHSSYQQIILK
jgi:hypothetical protein